MVLTNDGPDIFDPWLLLAVIAARTNRIKIGTMITPVSRRRPWVLARQTSTLDVLSGDASSSAPESARRLTVTSPSSATSPTSSFEPSCSTRGWRSSTGCGAGRDSRSPETISRSSRCGSLLPPFRARGSRSGSAAPCHFGVPCDEPQPGTVRCPIAGWIANWSGPRSRTSRRSAIASSRIAATWTTSTSPSGRRSPSRGVTWATTWLPIRRPAPPGGSRPRSPRGTGWTAYGAVSTSASSEDPDRSSGTQRTTSTSTAPMVSSEMIVVRAGNGSLT